MNKIELFKLIDKWFSEQDEYYNGSCIDGNFNLKDLAKHILKEQAMETQVFEAERMKEARIATLPKFQQIKARLQGMNKEEAQKFKEEVFKRWEESDIGSYANI